MGSLYSVNSLFSVVVFLCVGGHFSFLRIVSSLWVVVYLWAVSSVCGLVLVSGHITVSSFWVVVLSLWWSLVV